MEMIQLEADVLVLNIDHGADAETQGAALKTLNELELLLVGGGSGDVIF